MVAPLVGGEKTKQRNENWRRRAKWAWSFDLISSARFICVPPCPTLPPRSALTAEGSSTSRSDENSPLSTLLLSSPSSLLSSPTRKLRGYTISFLFFFSALFHQGSPISFYHRPLSFIIILPPFFLSSTTSPRKIWSASRLCCKCQRLYSPGCTNELLIQ